MATLAKLLQVDMGLPDMAKRLAASGRGKDTILAHINPREARLLKKHGGSGKINPDTGIMEFDDYYEDSNAGESEAQQYQQEQAAAEPVQSYAPAAQDPQQQAESQGQDSTQGTTNFGNEAVASGMSPGSVGAQQAAAGNLQGSQLAGALGVDTAPYTGASDLAARLAKSSNEAVASGMSPGSVGAAQAAQTPAGAAGTLTPQQAAAAHGVAGSPGAAGAAGAGGAAGAAGAAGAGGAGGAGANINLTDLLKTGIGVAGTLSGAKISADQLAKAKENEDEIRRLAEPYRQQGQQLMALGQGGGVTAAQQQALEAQRAQAMQQQANAGVTSGTAAQQTEAMLARQAAVYAQDNVKQGMAMMGVGDKYIKDAINTGYLQSQDAATISSDFFRNLSSLFPGFATPETTSGP